MPGGKWKARLSSSLKGPRYQLGLASQAGLGGNLCWVLSPQRSVGRMLVSVKERVCQGRPVGASTFY